MRARDRDRYLSVLYASGAVRPALFALHGIDLEMAAIVAGTTESMIGEIRLAWWREALEGLDQGVVPAQPLLGLAAEALVPHAVSGADLAQIEDRWLGMIDSDSVPPAHVTGGGWLFALAARLLAADENMGQALGEAWVLGEVPARVPGALRPLAGLAKLSARDAVRARAGLAREMRGSLGRQGVLLKAVLLG